MSNTEIKSNRQVPWYRLIALGLVATLASFSWGTEPDFRNLPLTDLDGKPVKISDYKGKALFINLFTTWCGPCKAEMGSIENARKQLEAEGMVFLMISEEDGCKLKEFTQKHRGYKMKYLSTPRKLRSLGINEIPMSYVIDRDGDLIYQRAGAAEWDQGKEFRKLQKAAE